MCCVCGYGGVCAWSQSFVAARDGQWLCWLAVPTVSKRCSVFLLVPQSPEEIDKEERPEIDAKKKSDEPGDDTDVFTEKHSENLFQRTEVLAGEALFAKICLSRNTTENRGDLYQIMQTQHLCFLGRLLNTFIGGSWWSIWWECNGHLLELFNSEVSLSALTPTSWILPPDYLELPLLRKGVAVWVDACGAETYFSPALPRAHRCLVRLVQMNTAWEELMAGMSGWVDGEGWMNTILRIRRDYFHA